MLDCYLNLALCFRNRLCTSASCNCIREKDNKIVRAVEGEPAGFVTVLCRILGLTRSRVKYLTASTYHFFLTVDLFVWPKACERTHVARS